MPKEQMDMQHDHCCDHGCCSRRSPVWRLIRVLVSVAIILLVLALGVKAGRMSELRKATGGPETMTWAKNFPIMPGASGKMMVINGSASGTTGNMMYQTTAAAQSMTRIAGVIVSVETGKITLTDNGGAQQVIYTTGDTAVTGATGEIPVSSLKAKQFIVSFVIAKDGKNTAQHIQVLQ